MNLPPCFLRIARIQINWLMKICMRYYAKYIVQYLYNFIQFHTKIQYKSIVRPFKIQCNE